MKILLLFLVLICTANNSCIIPTEARILKKDTKEWRKSTIKLHAYIDSPLSGTFLTLRENGKFENGSSGLIKSFEAGTWTNTQDTIKLIYLDSKLMPTKNQNIIIEKNSSTLIFEGDSTAVYNRLKILTNKL